MLNYEISGEGQEPLVLLHGFWKTIVFGTIWSRIYPSILA